MGCADEAISRWSAPPVILEFPRSVDFIKKIRMTYAQGYDDNGKPKIVIEKTEADAVFSGNKVTFQITQEENLRLNAKEFVQIEVQIYDTNGVPIVSDAVRVRYQDVINEGVSW